MDGLLSRDIAGRLAGAALAVDGVRTATVCSPEGAVLGSAGVEDPATVGVGVGLGVEGVHDGDDSANEHARREGQHQQVRSQRRPPETTHATDDPYSHRSYLSVSGS